MPLANYPNQLHAKLGENSTECNCNKQKQIEENQQVKIESNYKFSLQYREFRESTESTSIHETKFHPRE